MHPRNHEDTKPRTRDGFLVSCFFVFFVAMRSCGDRIRGVPAPVARQAVTSRPRNVRASVDARRARA